MFKIRSSQISKIMGVKGLGKTGETYVKNYIKEEVYKRKIEFDSKYTDKGNIVEDNSIDYVADKLGYGMLIKNEEKFENNFITGTPDVITKDLIIDVKNSWSFDTFPLLEDSLPKKDYYWQAQGYMDLVGIDNYKVVYVLSDTPDSLIEKEAYYWCRDNGYDSLDSDIYNEFHKKMTYSDVEDRFKIKVFDIKKNQSDIELIYDRVKECRVVYNRLTGLIKN